MGHVFMLGAQVVAGCISAPCLVVIVSFVWCSVCHCLEVCFACLLYVVLRARLAGCAWYLYGSWPMCSYCWSAILCAVLHCLDVLWPACCGCMLSVLFTIGGISMYCLNVFVAYVLCFTVSAPLSEGLCGILCLVLAGSTCARCFLHLPWMY